MRDEKRMGEDMKAVKVNKKLWTEACVEDLAAATPLCTRPLLEGCGGCGCCGGCCCLALCVSLIC